MNLVNLLNFSDKSDNFELMVLAKSVYQSQSIYFSEKS